jgi:predicted CopG family antitoxin
MAVKTITIDLDAYDLLSREKQKDESFSRVIKRRLGRGRTAADLLAGLKGFSLSNSALRGIETVLSRRADSMADSPKL